MVSSPARKSTTSSRRLSSTTTTTTRSRSDIIKSDVAKGRRRASSRRETGTIQVAVRMRPTQEPSAWKVAPSTNGKSFVMSTTTTTEAAAEQKQRSSQQRRFTFEKVFTGDDDDHTTNNTQTVYNAVVRNVVVAACSTGYNGAVFAYGQTSSGKTYTMQGSGTIREAMEKKDGGGGGGIVHFAARDIFDHVEEHVERSFSVRVSCIEIYNEKVYDLLLSSKSDGKKRKALEINVDPKDGGVKIANVKEEVVINCAGLLDVLSRSETNRSFAATAMNSRSSRSHTIFSITIESRATGSGIGTVRRSTLNLVDLAGSESVRHTRATGDRKAEGGMINKRQVVRIQTFDPALVSQIQSLSLSLLALSKIFIARSSAGKEPLSFRESKLTRLLQPSLEGNAQIAIICCVTPSRLYLDETESSLSFAARAKHVKNNPQINEITDAQPGERLRIAEAQIALLQKELKVERERGRRQLEFSLRFGDPNGCSRKRQRHSFDFVATTPSRTTQSVIRTTVQCPRSLPHSSSFREKEAKLALPLDKENSMLLCALRARRRNFGVQGFLHSVAVSTPPKQTNGAQDAERMSSNRSSCDHEIMGPLLITQDSQSPLLGVVDRDIACFVSGNYNAVKDNDMVTKEVNEAVDSLQSKTVDVLGGCSDTLQLFGETPHRCGRCHPDDHTLFTHYGTVFQASTIVPLNWNINVDTFWKKLGNMKVSAVLQNSMDQTKLGRARAKELFNHYFDLPVEDIEAATRRLVPSNDNRVRCVFNVLHTCQCCGASFLSQPLYRGHQHAWNGECPTHHCIDPRNLLGWSMDTVIALVLHNTVGDDGGHDDKLQLLDTRIAPDMIDKSSAEYRFESLMIVDQLIGIEDSCNDSASVRGRNDTLFRIMARKLMYVCDKNQRPAKRKTKMKIILNGGKGDNVRLVRMPFLLPFHYWPFRYKVRVEYWIHEWYGV